MTVYIIRSGEKGPVKIGRGANAEARRRALQTAHPRPLVMLREIEGGRLVERWMHDRFSRLRLYGEWFRFEDEMLTIEPPPLVDPASAANASLASRIIAKFGGVRKAAAKGNWAPSTVQSWKDAGLIPAQRQQEVLKAGADLTDPVTAADFFETPPASPEKPAEAAA